MNPKVDLYIAGGCGRCAFYATPQCKVKKWQMELETLRQVVIESGLTEELKWGVPCYTFNSKNIVIVAAFKDYCSISFFKGALLQDSKRILEKTSESMQSARFIKFKNTKEITDKASILESYILQAIEVEKACLKIDFKMNPEPIPEELRTKFDEYPALKKAFYALTPGRQRGYVIYFSQSKQAQTRIARIGKCMEQILNGKGLND
jgi:uncharacterized protein YdeI (YjbR/CyaY-like superfamily)